MKFLCRASNKAETSGEKLHAPGNFARSMDAQNLSPAGKTTGKCMAKSSYDPHRNHTLEDYGMNRAQDLRGVGDHDTHGI